MASVSSPYEHHGLSLIVQTYLLASQQADFTSWSTRRAYCPLANLFPAILRRSYTPTIRLQQAHMKSSPCRPISLFTSNTEDVMVATLAWSAQADVQVSSCSVISAISAKPRITSPTPAFSRNHAPLHSPKCSNVFFFIHDGHAQSGHLQPSQHPAQSDLPHTRSMNDNSTSYSPVGPAITYQAPILHPAARTPLRLHGDSSFSL